MHIPHYTIMDFAAGVYDVIYTRKIIFLVHITSYTHAEKLTNVLLYNQFYSTSCLFVCLFVL